MRRVVGRGVVRENGLPHLLFRGSDVVGVWVWILGSLLCLALELCPCG
jgi:hypothetical protein